MKLNLWKALFLILCRDLFDIDLRDMRLRVQERKEEQGAAQAVEPQRHLVTIHLEDGHGGHRYLNDIEMTSELQRFAQRVVSGSVTFSEGGGQILYHWTLLDQPNSERLIFPDETFYYLSGDVKDFNLATDCVPEPSTFVLLALGLMGLAFYRWRRSR